MLTYPAPAQEDDDSEEKQPETYAGNMSEGIRVGKGKYTWPDGSSYDGVYQSGCRHGKGTMKFADGTSVTGDFVSGILSGFGFMRYSNGDMYKGGFQNGRKHGEGCYHFAKFKCQFVGMFEQGAFKKGRWIHRDGSYVQAEFEAWEGQPENCAPVGAATRLFARPGLVQQGQFRNREWAGGEISAA